MYAYMSISYDVTTTAYTFTDKPQTVTHAHASSYKSLTEVTTYSYDHADRLSKVQHKLDGGATVTLAEYAYDNLGRLQSKKLGGTAHTATFAYNIRGWLTGITGSKFSQSLTYNNGTAGYNGNITSMSRTANGTSHAYTFAYDGLNRLTDAVHSAGRYTERVTAYDKNGNIKNLQRYGQTSASAYGLIDDLTFTLNGNRLSRVDDAATASAYGNGFEFKDGAKQADEYAYDANGNLTKDLNKNITNIRYNFLNLPIYFSFKTGGFLQHGYTADGVRRRTIYKELDGPTSPVTTVYCGNVIYENNVPRLLLHEEGYVTLDDNSYHYYVKDHQGNNCLVVDSSGAVEEANHYYPFGGVFASTGNVQPYKYNGKELDAKKGLNWYDYGARHYDAALGRFTTVDPLAENLYPWSSYAYCLNNPIKYVDPTGCLASTHTDSLGNVVEVYNDGDLGVYKHNTDFEGTKQELAENYSSNNTAAGGEKMGETYEWDSFVKPDTKEAYGQIDFGSFEASRMVFTRFRYLSTLKMKPLELAVYALNANNGEYFDIKHGDPYKGSQFGKGKYVSRRDAGNILAGMVARRGGLSAEVTYTAFGALQLAENNRLLLPGYLFKAANKGAKGFYGETPISHIFQKRGYELNFK